MGFSGDYYCRVVFLSGGVLRLISGFFFNNKTKLRGGVEIVHETGAGVETRRAFETS